MSNTFDAHEVERRTRASTYRDGLTELFAAAVLLAMAMAWAATPAFVGIFAAFIVLYGWKVVERVKERVTYPRLGYFRERSEDAGETGRGILIFVVVAFVMMVLAIAVFGDLTDSAEWRRAAPLFSGLTLAGAFWYVGDRSGLLRHRFVAVFSVVTGLGLWLLGSGETYETVIWHLLGLVLVLGAMGTWGLVHFLRTNPIRNDVTDA